MRLTELITLPHHKLIEIITEKDKMIDELMLENKHLTRDRDYYKTL